MYSKVKFGRSLFAALLLVVLCNPSVKANPDDSVTLHVGDKAPAIRYGKWLKGVPVTGFEKGKLYVFEFWATWCGPCIMMMPHLSELAEKYKGKITVVGVNIWENQGGHHSATTPDKFVKEMGKKMDYNVCTDTKDEFMGNNWMKAAGQGGIPCSFMIRDGVILWLGHPVNLDSVIQVVQDGKYDPAAVKEEFKKKEAEEKEQEAAFKAVMAPIEAAQKKEDWPGVLRAVDSGITKLPQTEGYMNFIRFQTLLDHFGEDTALAFAKPWQEKKQGFVGSTAAVIVKKKGLKMDTYLFAAGLLQQLIDNPNGVPPLYHDLMAEGYANGGDYKKAAEIEEMAVNEGKQALNDGKFAGLILKETVAGYEKKLADYKSHLK